ncbi:hypothetical protein ALC60_10618 [Trachymyrmex zeteki]|uniref:Uncharacterized protein n=1 Tax=Mycetomoellerius zeteki TaxID=64791 RepID=A0A151WR24_9HYME|nr:hypothetical protein ALC60_10618 [Trachymyrmex zeteki]
MPGDSLPLLLGESAFPPTGTSGYRRRCDAAFWLFTETGTATLPQPVTRNQRTRDQTRPFRENRDGVENENNDNVMTNTTCYYEYTSGNVTDGGVIYWPALSLPSRKLASFQVQRYLVVAPISVLLVKVTNDTIGKPK